MWVMWEIPPLLMVVLPGTQTYEFSRLYSCCGKIKSQLKAKPVEKQQHSMNSIHSSSDTKYVHLVLWCRYSVSAVMASCATLPIS